MAQVLQFQPLNSAVEAAFWHELGEMKIDHFKLDDKARPVQAYYSTGTTEEIPPRLCLGSNALSTARSASSLSLASFLSNISVPTSFPHTLESRLTISPLLGC